MELFSELYNCYYQVVRSILTQPTPSVQSVYQQITEAGYEESVLFLLPKLMEGDWQLLKKDKDVICSKISTDFYVPLTNLQKSFLKSILSDEKICLFLSDTEICHLQEALSDVEPLWTSDDFLYYDVFSNGDDFSNPTYIEHFRLLLHAIEHHHYIHMISTNKADEMIPTFCLPCRLEYSVRNNKFRLLSLLTHKGQKPKLSITNLERIQSVTLSSIQAPHAPNLNLCLETSYYREPVTFLIRNERNALERAMLQFANYNKKTTKLDNNTYECVIYYNKNVETELLIEVLSFGPMLKVVGHEGFLKQIRQRLKRQKNCNGIYQNAQF